MKTRAACNRFPSKIAESFSLGTPVIANLTSDLADFLIDGTNSFIAEGDRVVDFQRAIAKALYVSELQLAHLKDNALQTAEESFSITAHSKSITDFLSVLTIDS